MRCISSIIWWLCAVWVMPVHAQSDGKDVLHEIADRIRDMKTYSYEAEARARFADGSRDTMQTLLYMDAPGRRLLYETGHELYLVTPQWAYQADHDRQTVGVFNVKAYGKKYKNLPSPDRYFNNSMSEIFMDSVLLRTAVVQSVKHEKDQVSLSLGFPADSYLRAMHIVYDRRKQFPVTIHVRTFYPDGRYPAGTDGKVGGTAYEITCRNYTEQIPAGVFDTQRYFSVNNGKVLLKKFHHYKLTMVL